MAVHEEDIVELRKRFLECAVCLCSFDEQSHQPKALPCQHSFCNTCLVKLTKDNTVVCPVCQVQHKMDKEKGFPKDNTRRDLLDFVKQRSSDLFCTQCEIDSEMVAATSHCAECDDMLCQECTKAHKRTRITSKHELVSFVDNSTLLVRRPLAVPSNEGQMCTVQGHENQPLDQYCSDGTCRTRVCRVCVQGAHRTHPVARLSGAYREYQSSLKCKIDELKKRLVNLRDTMTSVKATADDIKTGRTSCEDEIKKRFDNYQNILEDRKKGLLSDVRGICREQVVEVEAKLEEFQKHAAHIENLLSCAETAVANAEPGSFLEVEPTITGQIDEILERTKQDRLEVVAPVITFHTDDLVKAYLSGIGNVATGEHTTSIGMDGNRPKSTLLQPSMSSVTDSGHSIFDQHKMELLKLATDSISSSDPVSIGQHSYTTSRLVSQASKHPIQQDTFTIIDLNKAKKNIQNSLDIVPNVRDTGVSKCRLQMYNSDKLRLQVVKRFKTWSLIGYWETTGNDVVMYGRSEDEAEQGLQMLREAVVERAVPVKPTCMFLLESDKWQILKVELQQARYPKQMLLDVVHDSYQVVCYATNSSILQDAVDFIRIFLRDNDVKTATLTYPGVVVKAMQKSFSKDLKSISHSLSQFCVDIKTESDGDNGRVIVKGIGIGFGHAILKINKLVGLCVASAGKDDDEERFSSDEDDEETLNADDEDSRFEEAPVNVQLTAELAITGIEAFTFHAMSMAGEAALLFAATGDITELPVEAIVNAADQKLRHNGGLAKVIVEKGGRIIQQQCTEYVSTAGSLKPGDVYCSTAGALPFTAIIHAVSPKWKGGSHNEEKILRDAVYKSLIESQKRKITSLAIPALGTGAYSYPLDLATTCIVNTVADFMNAYPHTCLRELYLIDINPETAPVFGKAMEDTFGAKDTICFSPHGHNENQSGVTSGQARNQTGTQPISATASAQIRRVFGSPLM